MAREEGFSLIEVVMAMFIFALVSTGIMYSLLSILAVSRDSRARQVASNLAAEEIDLARGVNDVVNGLVPETKVRELNGDTYTITRRVEWVTDTASALKCGASPSGDKLQYKKVNVEVTWDNMRTTSPVRADTVVNPTERVNDPLKGTILITVLRSDGTGAQGVAVSASPSLGSAVNPTDALGCAFALKVNPGTYTVNLSKSGFVDEKNVAVASKAGVVVTAGSTMSLSFQYDNAARYSLSVPVAAAPTNAQRPNSLPYSFVNTYRTHVATGTSHNMHPDSAGYAVMAGNATVCPASDPTNWPTSDDGTLLNTPLTPVGSQPGDIVALDVPMATVAVSGASSIPIRAVSRAGAAGGDCSSSVTYTFPAMPGATRTIALPYGAWDIYRGTSVPGTFVTSVVLDPRLPAGG
jgi:prepilin-type N-terminal cleavage/methylation domain-containing protein